MVEEVETVMYMHDTYLTSNGNSFMVRRNLSVYVINTWVNRERGDGEAVDLPNPAKLKLRVSTMPFTG